MTQGTPEQQRPDQYRTGPSYTNQQYGPGSYGQPVGDPRAGGRARKVGVAALVLAILGAAAVVVSYTVLDWLDVGKTGFTQLHDLATESGSDASTITKFYFAWLGWALVAVAFVFAVLAALPAGVRVLGKIVGVLAGLGGIAATFFALKSGSTFKQVFDHGGPGFYTAMAGFLVLAIGALIGSRKA